MTLEARLNKIIAEQKTIEARICQACRYVRKLPLYPDKQQPPGNQAEQNHLPYAR